MAPRSSPSEDKGISDAIDEAAQGEIFIPIAEAVEKGMVNYFGPKLFQAYMSQVHLDQPSYQSNPE